MANGEDGAGAGPPPWQEEDVGTLFTRFMLFLSSYAPLFLILAIRFQSSVLKEVCGGLCGLGVLYLVVVLLYGRAAQQAHLYRVGTVSDASGEVAGYLATYILPFVTIPSPSGADIAGYCILAVVVAAIFIRSDLAAINPTLYLIGLRVVVIADDGNQHHLISHRVPRPGATVNAIKVAGILVKKA